VYKFQVDRSDDEKTARECMELKNKKKKGIKDRTREQSMRSNRATPCVVYNADRIS